MFNVDIMKALDSGCYIDRLTYCPNNDTTTIFTIEKLTLRIDKIDCETLLIPMWTAKQFYNACEIIGDEFHPLTFEKIALVYQEYVRRRGQDQ